MSPALSKNKLIKHLKKARQRIVMDICKPLVLDDDELLEVKSILLQEIKRGLCERTHNSSSVKCLLSYIQKLPTGCERGNFLTVYIMGWKFRIQLVQIFDEENITYETAEHDITEKDKNSKNGFNYFDYVASHFSKFIFKYKLESDELIIGMVFSFPIFKTSVTQGILKQCGKGFNCSDIVGKDLATMFREAIERKHKFRIKSIIIANDTSSVLIGCAWTEPTTKIGVVIDEGINACYVEKTKYIERFKSENKDGTEPYIMIINTELGGFGDNGVLNFIRNKYDEIIDKASPQPGNYIFEKMTSGMYLGEIVRLILIDCIKAGALLDGVVTKKINTPYIFTTAYVINISNEATSNSFILKYIFSIMDYDNLSPCDVNNIRYVCTMVSSRSTKLLAASVACLIDRIGDPYISIGWDGYLCRTHPHFIDNLTKAIQSVVRAEHTFSSIYTPEGSKHGGGLLAATLLYKKLQRPTTPEIFRS